MTRFILTLFVLITFVSSAEARQKRVRVANVQPSQTEFFGLFTQDIGTTTTSARRNKGPKATSSRRERFRTGACPRRPCGCMMQRITGITSASVGINLDLARNWRYVGSPGNGSAGEIFSQYGHVSKIVGPGRRPGTVKTVSHRPNGTVYYVDRRLSSGVARRI